MLKPDHPGVPLAIYGRTSHRKLFACAPLTWMRLMMFVAREGYHPDESDRHGIAPERAEAFSAALERALLFTPECDRATQARAWWTLTTVPNDSRLTMQQMAEREVRLVQEDSYRDAWCDPGTRDLLEKLRHFVRAEGGVTLERTP